MPARTTPPFRADHVGSLLRPPELLRAVEDRAIASIVQMQRDVGLQSATDGEFRRATWHMDFIYQLGGIGSAKDENLKVQFFNRDGKLEFTSAALKVHDKVRLERPIFADHFQALTALTDETGATPKLTIPSPSMVHY